MASIEKDGKTVEIKDGDNLQWACEELDVPFACRNGSCGCCLIEVEEGLENLNDLTEEENDFGLEGCQRLGCQCKIKKGHVKLR